MSLRVDLLDALAPEVKAVMEQCGNLAADRGERAYLVGGRVRDLLLGLPSDDVDVVVVGDAMALAQAVARADGGSLQRFHAFQTARVELPDVGKIDFATARSEIYLRPGELPQVEVGSLQEDLARRDFTINTLVLALNPETWGHLADPFGGLADMEERCVRVLHERSFADDPTRLLRALRFATRFGYQIEPRTLTAMAEAVRGGYLEEISGARLRREIDRLLSEQPIEGPQLLSDHGMLAALCLGLRVEPQAHQRMAEIRGAAHSAPLKAALAKEAPWTLVLATMARGLDQQSRWTLVRRLRMSREEREPIIGSGEAWSAARRRVARSEVRASRVAACLDGVGVGALTAALALEQDPEMATLLERYLERWRWVVPSLGGVEVAASGVAEGPAIGQVLGRLRAAWLDGEITDAAAERELLARLAREAPN